MKSKHQQLNFHSTQAFNQIEQLKTKTNRYAGMGSFDDGSGPIISLSYINLDLSMMAFDEGEKRKARLKEQQAQHQKQIQKQMQEGLKDKL